MSAPDASSTAAGSRPSHGAALVGRIGVVVHPSRRVDDALTRIREWARDHGAELVQLAVPGQDREVAPWGEADDCDFVVALGGDGTVLSALHAAARSARPVIGIACGSLGALAAVGADHVAAALDRMADGGWTARRLPALTLEDEREGARSAINDFVFTRAGAGQISVSIVVDGELFVRFGGDGLIVSTAIGSSAYTLAAGGPLVLPEAGGIVLTPLAPHGGSCPPLVAGDGTRIEVLVEPGHGGARVEADGQPAGELPRLQVRRLAISLVPEYATLAMIDEQERLLTGLRRRGILMDSPRLLARDARLAAAASDDLT